MGRNHKYGVTVAKKEIAKKVTVKPVEKVESYSDSIVSLVKDYSDKFLQAVTDVCDEIKPLSEKVLLVEAEIKPLLERLEAIENRLSNIEASNSVCTEAYQFGDDFTNADAGSEPPKKQNKRMRKKKEV